MFHSTLQQTRQLLAVLLAVLLTFSGVWAAETTPANPNAFAPSISVSTSSLNGFSTQEGTPSAVKSYTFTVTDITPPEANPDFNVTVSGDFEIGLSASGPFSSSIPLNLNSGGDLTQVIFARIKATATQGTTVSAAINHFLNVIPAVSTPVVLLSGSVSAAADKLPTISVAPAILSSFSTVQGTASGSQFFTISAATIATGQKIRAVVPNGFEIATAEAGPYQEIIDIDLNADGTLSKKIFVRMHSGSPVGSVFGEVVAIAIPNNTPFAKVQVSGTVSAQTASMLVNPTSLSGFVSDGANPSQTKQYDLTLTGITKSVDIQTTGGFEIQLDSPTPQPFTNSLDVNFEGTRKINVRLKAGLKPGTRFEKILHNSLGFNTVKVELTGSVSSPASGSVTVDKDKIDLSTTQGTASEAKSFVVTASGFSVSPAKSVHIEVGNVNEISTNVNGPYSKTLDLLLTNGALTATTVFVRIKATAPESGGATSIDLTVDDVEEAKILLNILVNAPDQSTFTLNPTSLSGFSTVKGSASAVKSYVFTHTESIGGEYTITAPNGFEVSTSQNSDFAKSIVTSFLGGAGGFSASIFVRLTANAPAGAINGTITHFFKGANLGSLTVNGNVSEPTGNPNPPVVTGNFDGHIYGVDCSTIRGWVFDKNDKNKPFTVEILDGATVIGTILADDFRPDLLNAGIGNGKHAFTFDTPNSLKDGKSHSVSIRVQANGFLLKGGPKTLNCSDAPTEPNPPTDPNPPTNTGTFEGFLDKIECGTIRGWAWDASKPNQPVSVEFLIDGESVGSTSADIFRPDLKAAGLGNGAHAYSFTTPAKLKDGKEHLISAKVLNSGFTLKWAPQKVKLSCASGARESFESAEISRAWNVEVLGNPIMGDVLEAEIHQAQGQTLRVDVVNLSGRSVAGLWVEVTESQQKVQLPLVGQSPGLYLLQVLTPRHRQVIKVIKN